MDMLIALIGAGSGGSFLAIGATANTRLRKALQSSIGAATINFIVGSLTLTLLILLGTFGSQSLDRLTQVPWWAFLSGLLGAVYVTLNTIIIPKLGLTTAALAVVCSQMTGSLLIDQWGWFGVTPHPISPSRIVAIVLLLIAVALTQFDRSDLGNTL
ncbi:integral membrane protein [Pseudanabaena sp. lw0831]|uniref:DMT family transporter n=1 Tax=Pseudanabaena sp. lw0831 TaxID=1357935 RepID=UPI001914F836|nr:DMT family transporter [Pseudanabaena sp. lw0831]GBO54555.1 integral membrane protein [Pseudanabaena sp. lw0831]